MFPSCEDGADNDGDTAVDSADDGCAYPKPLPGDDAVKGDADCSGEIDSIDALRVLRTAAELPVPGGCEASMDVNCTGATDVADALSILRYVAALPVNLPVECVEIGQAA